MENVENAENVEKCSGRQFDFHHYFLIIEIWNNIVSTNNQQPTTTTATINIIILILVCAKTTITSMLTPFFSTFTQLLGFNKYTKYKYYAFITLSKLNTTN